MAIKRGLLIGVAAILTVSGCTRSNRAERVVLIVVDTLRADVLRPYGGSVRAPAMERLAQRGTVYGSAVGSFHLTTMSMGAMFTGRTPSLETGDVRRPMQINGRYGCGMARFRDAGTGKQCIPPSLQTLGEAMRAAEYETIAVVSNGLLFRPFGMDQGFDDWSEVGESRIPRNPKKRQLLRRACESRRGEAVNAAVEAALERRKSDRFFLYVHYMDAHDYRAFRAPYRAAVAKADRSVAGLLRIMEKEELLENTVFVLTSDHGERLQEKHFVPGTIGHGGNPSFGEVLRIPLIVSPPVGGIEDRLFRTSDVFALVARIGGAKAAENTDLRDDEIFLGESEWRTYQRGRWKTLLRREDDRLFLVDLERDPGETRDVSDDHPEIAAEHRARIGQLTRDLAAEADSPRVLTEEDEERLRALGYVD
jgi:arylsulfatase A-like enzyme